MTDRGISLKAQVHACIEALPLVWDIRKQTDKVMDGTLANFVQIKMTEVS